MIIAVIVIVAVMVVPMIPTMIIPMLILAITMLFPVTRNILTVVPVALHEVDPLAAGIVLTAVRAPIFGIAWRYAQIDGWTIYRYPLDRYRPTVDHLRLRIAADVYLAVEAGFADADRDANVGRKRRGVMAAALAATTTAAIRSCFMSNLLLLLGL